MSIYNIAWRFLGSLCIILSLFLVFREFITFSRYRSHHIQQVHAGVESVCTLQSRYLICRQVTDTGRNKRRWWLTNPTAGYLLQECGWSDIKGAGKWSTRRPCVCVCRWYMLQIDLHDKICLSLIVCVEEKANMLEKKLIKYSYGFGWRKTLYENCSTDETSTTNINWRIHISITGK
jgi:hypothetical protein